MLSTLLMMRRSARPNRSLSKTIAVAVPSAVRGRTSRLVADAGIMHIMCPADASRIHPLLVSSFRLRFRRSFHSQSNKSAISSVDQVLQLPPRACRSIFRRQNLIPCVAVAKQERLASKSHLRDTSRAGFPLLHSHLGAPKFIPNCLFECVPWTSHPTPLEPHLLIRLIISSCCGCSSLLSPAKRYIQSIIIFGEFEHFSSRPFGIVQKNLFCGIPFGRA